ncbi:19100_t:CDS:2, partial [Gigaspora rosea]
GVDPADNMGGPPTGREVAIGYFRGSLGQPGTAIVKLRAIEGRQATYRHEELRRKFLDALPLPWLEKAEDIGEHLPLDELAKKLYEIELQRIARHKRDKIPDPLVSQQIYEPSPVLASQQQEISLANMKKRFQDALKTPSPIPSKNIEQLRYLYESNNLFDGPPVPYKPDKLRSAKIDRLETIMGKVADTVGSVADSVPIEHNQPETYNELLPKLSLAMRKMCLSRKALEKESDEWFSSLQYLNANINDLAISESFLDPRSEFGGINDPAIKMLGWKADKPSDFVIKGNSKHITDSLGWFTDMPVTMKDKKGKTVTIIENFVHIDNREPEPMLFLGVPEPNKNQFCIKLHRKTYVIPTYSKAPVAKEPSKEEQNQNMAICVKELEKALFSSIQSNLEIIGYYNILLNRYEKISLEPNKVE